MFLVADGEKEHFHRGGARSLRENLITFMVWEWLPPPWTLGISSPPQGLPDPVFQQSRPGTSGRAAKELGGSWEWGAGMMYLHQVVRAEWEVGSGDHDRFWVGATPKPSPCSCLG